MAKEASSREDDIKREFNFATHSIISQVLRGVLVGIFAGLVVGVFRFLIEKIFHLVQDVYHRSQQSLLWLLALVFLDIFLRLYPASVDQDDERIKEHQGQ